MARPLKPERVWWHEPCGAVIAGAERPLDCRCRKPGTWDDFGWRVGQHAGNYSFYSTYERALTDRRTK